MRYIDAVEVMHKLNMETRRDAQTQTKYLHSALWQRRHGLGWTALRHGRGGVGVGGKSSGRGKCRSHRIIFGMECTPLFALKN